MPRRCLVLLLLAGACSGGRDDSIQAAEQKVDPSLAAYLRRIAELSPKETAALEAVAAHTGERYEDDATLLSALQGTALPRYREFAAGLKGIQPPPGKLADFHGRLTRLADEELALLERLAAALERGDGTQVLFINREHARVREQMDALVRELAR